MLSYVDPLSKRELTFDEVKQEYKLDSKTVAKVIDGIPRFVGNEAYASAFGLQWRMFRKTQLDSFTQTTITEDRLKGVCKNNITIFQDKNVLEVGSGAGRFSEVLLKYGAKLHSTDLSSAVSANNENFKGRANYQIAQADLRKLPYEFESFDTVVCLGVIQHTPNPEATIAELTHYVKKGGTLLIDHYTNGIDKSEQKHHNVFFTKALLRRFLLIMPNWFTIRFTYLITWLLWPIHKALFKRRNKSFFKKLKNYFSYVSPIHDYQDSFPQLGSRLLFEWAILDTHDACTDRYKHLRSVRDIQYTLENLGYSNINVWYGGNGVEAMAVK